MLIAQLSFSQKGKIFPSISGETAVDKKVTIPTDTKGKFTLIGMAYSKAAEDELKTWYQPVYSTFIEKPKPGLFNESYDVNLYFIPMFTGLNQAATEVAKKKAKQGIDSKLLPYIVFYKGELKQYKEQLEFEKKDTPYFFVLDQDGKIVFATSGKYSDDKLEKIEEVLSAE